MPDLRQVTWATCFIASAAVVSMTPAKAFEGAPKDRSAAVVAPDHADQTKMTPLQALRNGAKRYYSGDKVGAVSSLQYAAENGQPMAAWKLGEMYASGDGVKEDDIKAFEYYSQIVREHGNDRPDSPDAPFIASAFVALGKYYLEGIDGEIHQNENKARQIFIHAASYFGDAKAQYELGLLYQGKNDRMAVRWYNLAALKGSLSAQARLGQTLYDMSHSEQRKARGLMWMNVAQLQADGHKHLQWIQKLHEKYFASCDATIRTDAAKMSKVWLERNRPDLVNMTQASNQ